MAGRESEHREVEDQSEEGSLRTLEAGDNIDVNTFEQILEMDEEDDREFSTSIVFGFFDQAESTFQEMDDAVEARDLPKLSSLGHFLKGSSATLGLVKVRDSCEQIQHYGLKKDGDGTTDQPDEDLCLERIKERLAAAKKEYAEAEAALRKFYGH